MVSFIAADVDFAAAGFSLNFKGILMALADFKDIKISSLLNYPIQYIRWFTKCDMLKISKVSNIL